MAEDIKQIIEESAGETRRHFDVVAEDLSAKIHTVAEGVDTNSQHLERLKGVPGQLEKIDTRLGAIETILESVNLPVLKQKVASLEKRIEELEKAR